MNRTQLLQGFVITLFLLLTACSTSKYSTLIVGLWKVDKENISKSSSGTELPDSSLQQTFMQNEAELTLFKEQISEQRKGSATVEEVKEKVMNAVSEYGAIYVFTSQGMGSREIPGGESMKGTYKLKRNGKQLILNNHDNTKSFKLYIDTLTSSKMVIHNINLPEDMHVTYIKQ